MKKRAKYNKNPFEFHREVVERKRLSRREKSSLLRRKIRRRFGLYKKMLDDDNLEELRNHHLNMADNKAEAFRWIYSFRAKKFKELKLELTTTPERRVNNLCPYCQLDKVGTLDHILPKTPFPEYSSMPWNLIPCCSTCNSKKDDVWLDNNNKRCFINYYIDDIPPIQYFFADVSLLNGKIEIEYNLRFPAGYPADLKARIESHYKKLDLVKRYLENSDDVVEELKFVIRNYAPGVSDVDIINSVKNICNDKQALYGINYWEAVLEKACVSSNAVYTFLKLP